jgi:hypothetical protein
MDGWMGYVPSKRRFLQRPRGVTSQKTAFFIVTAVITSNVTIYRKCLEVALTIIGGGGKEIRSSDQRSLADVRPQGRNRAPDFSNKFLSVSCRKRRYFELTYIIYKFYLLHLCSDRIPPYITNRSAAVNIMWLYIYKRFGFDFLSWPIRIRGCLPTAEENCIIALLDETLRRLVSLSYWKVRLCSCK